MAPAEQRTAVAIATDICEAPPFEVCGRLCAPDAIEPVVGWRLWLVVADGGYLWLESVLHAERWSPHRSLGAVCRSPRRRVRAGTPTAPVHAAPEENCACGIYAASEPTTLAPYLDGGHARRGAVARVLGRVSIWGRVIEAERGWRGEYAYPAHVYVPPAGSGFRSAFDLVDGLRDYGVPVELLRRDAAA